MKFLRKTAKYTLFEHKRNEDVLEVLKKARDLYSGNLYLGQASGYLVRGFSQTLVS
jgi:hypothetical protein